MKYQTSLLAFALLLVIRVSADEAAAQSAGQFSINASRVPGARIKKIFPIFSIIRFANDPCTGQAGYNGTCYTSSQCSAIGGSVSGSCALGFGVCCYVNVTGCGATTRLNGTYWQNPGFPDPYYTPGQCSVTINNCSANICHLRLDFVTFSIAQPDSTAPTVTGGQCLTDVFTVTGQSNNVPAICGTNSNSHIYLNLTPNQGSYTLNMILSGTATARSWVIRVSQIPCGTAYSPPNNCLQWFTDPVGQITSFNYLFASTPTLQHLANQDYTICIRTNMGFCGISYAACTAIASGVDAFGITGTTNSSGADGLCTTDWIQIPCGTDRINSALTAAGAACPSKFCGGSFNAIAYGTSNAPVYSYRLPFELRFYTDSYEIANENSLTGGSVGFCLQYTQQTCYSG